MAVVVVAVAAVTDLIPTTSLPPPPPLRHTPAPSILLTTCWGFLLSRTGGGAHGVRGWVEGVQGGGGGQDTGVSWMGVEETEEGVAGVVAGEGVWGYMWRGTGRGPVEGWAARAWSW